MATSEQLAAIRKKYGLGEFKLKPAGARKAKPSTRASASMAPVNSRHDKGVFFTRSYNKFALP